MVHELPNGKLNVFDIDLSYMTLDEFCAMQDVIERHAYITRNYPGQQRLMVYWNFEETPDMVIGLPRDSVSPHLDKT